MATLLKKSFLISNCKKHNVDVTPHYIIEEWRQETFQSISSWLISSRDHGYFCDQHTQKNLLRLVSRLERLDRVEIALRDSGKLFIEY